MEADPNGAYGRERSAEHELPAISRARNATWQLKDSLPAQNLPGRGLSVVLVLVAAIESVLTSGIVFGWAPLQLLLQEEGIYGDLCPDGPPCEEQAVRLDLIYTAATSAFCFCVWPTGLVCRPSRPPRRCASLPAGRFPAATGRISGATARVRACGSRSACAPRRS
jgi:hypothetical protein